MSPTPLCHRVVVEARFASARTLVRRVERQRHEPLHCQLLGVDASGLFFDPASGMNGGDGAVLLVAVQVRGRTHSPPS